MAVGAAGVDGTLGMSAGGTRDDPGEVARGVAEGVNCWGGGPTGCNPLICAIALPGASAARVSAKTIAMGVLIISATTPPILSKPQPGFFDRNRGEFKPPQSASGRTCDLARTGESGFADGFLFGRRPCYGRGEKRSFIGAPARKTKMPDALELLKTR